MADDFLADMIRQVLEASTAGTDAVRKTEIRIRQQWGGARVYIKKAPVEGKVQRLADGLAAGVSLHEAFTTAGVSRRWGYQLLSRRQRKW